jgi:hypothetical protein
MGQTMDTFNQFAGNQRAMAADQAGQAMTQGLQGLDTALADRGMARGSGVAAAGASQLAQGQAEQMAGLNRDLANQAGQLGLQGAQFDINRMLQEQQMGSQFALGAGAQRGQNLGMAGNMLGQAYQAPLQMQQQLFQQNQMNPYMQMMGMTNPMQMLQMGFGGAQQGLDYAAQNAMQGGAGFGAGMSNLTGQMFDFLSNKS